MTVDAGVRRAFWAETRVVVLVGGLGTRIRHLLGEFPKPMAPAAGRPFVEWVTRWLARQGAVRITLSAGYQGEIVERHFSVADVPGAKVEVIREPEPLGTAGGFNFAAEHIRQRDGAPRQWVVLNGDSLILADLGLAIARLLALDGVLLGRSVPDTRAFGTLEVDANGLLRRFGEKQPAADPAPGLINAGVYLLTEALARRLPAARASFEYDAFPTWLANGARIGVVAVDAPFLDIGAAHTLPLAGEFVTRHQDDFA